MRDYKMEKLKRSEQMRIYKLIVIITVHFLVSVSYSQIHNGYELFFSDEFDSTVLDESVWYYRTDAKHQSIQLKENVILDSGSLKLDLTVLNSPVQGKNYGGAGIVTKERFHYGYYEVKAKIGDAINHDGDNLTDEGWHHAFWAMAAVPTDGSINTTYPGVRRTEIDCYEYTDNFTKDSIARFTQHIIVWKPDGKEWGRLPTPPEDLNEWYGFNTNNWHTYGFKWNEDRVVFFIDNEISKIAEYPSDRFEHDSINVWITAISANWTNSDPEQSEARYAYFRYYRPDEVNPPVPPATVSNLIAEEREWSVYLSWDENPEKNIYSYNIYRSSNSGESYELLAKIPGTEYEDYSVTGKQAYSYKICAFDSTGEMGAYSEAVRAIPFGDPGSNIAQGKPVTVSSELNSTYIGSNAVDGNKVDNSSRWLSEDTPYPHWIEVDLESKYELSMLKLWTGYNGYNKPLVDFEFQEWNGNEWASIFTESDNSKPEYFHSLDTLITDKVRLYITRGEDNIVRLYELELYGIPYVETKNEAHIYQQEIAVIPNPIRGDELFFTPQPEAVQVDIVNTLGQVLKSNLAMGEINISDLTPGRYFLRVGSNRAVSFIRN
jgi:beta-glucanase (GH16 family)